MVASRVFWGSLFSFCLIATHVSSAQCLQQASSSGGSGAEVIGPNSGLGAPNALIMRESFTLPPQLVELAGPSSLVPRGTLSFTRPATWGCALAPGYVLVAASDLLIFDITNPGQPTQVNSISVPFLAQNVTYENGLAFIITSLGTLEIYDASNLPNATWLGSLNTLTGGNFTRIIAAGTMVCLAPFDRFASVEIIDVSVPGTPQRISDFPNLSPRVADIDGNTLVVGGEHAFTIIDIQDPNHPVQLSSYAMGTSVTGLAIDESNLYVATVSEITRFDISVRNDPRPLDQTTASPGVGLGIGLVHRDNRLYASDVQSGIVGFELNSCTGAVLRGDCDSSGSLDWPDFQHLAVCLLGSGGPGDAFCSCVDIDGDGQRTILDASLMQLRFGG